MKVSIITPVKNGSKYISECIESVLNQDHNNIEHIIIDGESTDNTLDIIKSYGNKIAYCKSKKDKNMYSAINFGLSVSTGDIIACLNSDDYYYNPDVVSKAVKNIRRGNKAVYGNIVKFYEDTKRSRFVKLHQTNYKSLLLSRHSTFLPQPSLFMEKQIYTDFGNFIDDYYFSSDYDFILKVLKNNNIKYINSYFTVFRQHEEQITKAQTKKMIAEKKQILDDNEYGRYSIFIKVFYYLKNWSYFKWTNIFRKEI
jgi:glycosyltransferase involved in cell wall biosynthesis